MIPATNARRDSWGVLFAYLNNVGIECGLVRYAYQVATRTDGEKAFETCTIHIYANVLPQETLTPIVRRKQAK